MNNKIKNKFIVISILTLIFFSLVFLFQYYIDITFYTCGSGNNTNYLNKTGNLSCIGYKILCEKEFENKLIFMMEFTNYCLMDKNVYLWSLTDERGNSYGIYHSPPTIISTLPCYPSFLKSGETKKNQYSINKKNNTINLLKIQNLNITSDSTLCN